jgi:hypothetical protein
MTILRQMKRRLGIRGAGDQEEVSGMLCGLPSREIFAIFMEGGSMRLARGNLRGGYRERRELLLDARVATVWQALV